MEKKFDDYVFTATRALTDYKTLYIGAEAYKDKQTSALYQGGIYTAIFLLGLYLSLKYKRKKYHYYCEYNENISPDENVDYVIKNLNKFFKMER